MEVSRGLCSDPEDGVLRGRVGFTRWLLQALLLTASAVGVAVVVLLFLLHEALLAFVVTLTVAGGLFASLKFCLRPWAWMGLDSHLPILFDLESQGLEVGTWDYCVLRRRFWPAEKLKDLRLVEI